MPTHHISVSLKSGFQFYLSGTWVGVGGCQPLLLMVLSDVGQYMSVKQCLSTPTVSQRQNMSVLNREESKKFYANRQKKINRNRSKGRFISMKWVVSLVLSHLHEIKLRFCSLKMLLDNSSMCCVYVTLLHASPYQTGCYLHVTCPTCSITYHKIQRLSPASTDICIC
jgi:hypothetical protein